MKRSALLVVFLGLLAGRTAMGQALLCAGAAASSTACAAPCSGTVVNDNVRPDQENLGKFNVGYANRGDGNDGFANVGSFNIGAGNNGNCNQLSGGTVGFCDVNNSQGQIVLRFCNVYPTDPKCQPGTYLPEFSQALQTQIAAVVASCNGGPPVIPFPPVVSPPTLPPSVLPPGSVLPPATPAAPVLAPGAADFMGVSDSKPDPITLLKLFTEHLEQEKAAGRKLLL